MKKMNEQQLIRLVESLTLEEKIGQLMQLTAEFFDQNSKTVEIGPLKKLGLENDFDINNVGSILNTTNPNDIRFIQQKTLEQSRHKIPLLFMADIIYGMKTILPIPLAQVSSWNMKEIKESAKMMAAECYEMGIHVTFSPMVDIVRDPRWGRVMESPGEDTYLASRYAKAMVEGIQGSVEEQQIPDSHIAACVKHFAAYGAPSAGREYNTVELSEHTLREFYLPSYYAAIQAGAKLVMTAFNTINGIPATGNQWLNRGILRDEFDFNGVLISDYAAVEELIVHGYAEDKTDAAKKAFLSGVDIDMKTAVYANELPKLIEENPELHPLLDTAVLRVLNLKNDLGLFDDPYRGITSTGKTMNKLLSNVHQETALRLAEESIVLLKNDHDQLPIKEKERVALIGPYAKESSTLGFWAITGDEKDTVTLEKGLKKYLSPDDLKVARGSFLLDPETIESYDKYSKDIPAEKRPMNKLMDEAIQIAENSDKIILAVGESVYQSGEGGSRVNPTLPEPQVELIHKMSQLDKPIILVVYSGRPLILTDIESKVDAILYAWFPGTMGGDALANLLMGEVSPSGKLPMTFPRSVGQIPMHYNEFATGRPRSLAPEKYRFASKYLDESNLPLYSFGYGLSYTSFVYHSLKVSSAIIKDDRPIEISIMLENTGNREGKEIVQLYICDVAASVVRPIKELKDFKKVTVASKTTKEVTFKLTEEQLRFHQSSGRYSSEPGKFIVTIAANSTDEGLKTTIIYEK